MSFDVCFWVIVALAVPHVWRFGKADAARYVRDHQPDPMLDAIRRGEYGNYTDVRERYE